jgi:tetratricopeptide (TPR) repeat protein
MGPSWELVADILIALVLLAGLIWFLAFWMRHSRDEPVTLILKWCATGLAIMAFLITAALPYTRLLAPIVAAVCGVLLSILWTPNIVEVLFKPLWHAWTGGDEQPEPRPFYAIARAKRQRGQYAAALAEVRAQLARFPHDFEGHMLAAEILAQNMLDLDGAELTIQRLIQLPEITDPQKAYALSTLADWYLRIGQDTDNARRILQQLVEQHPDTDLATTARQRLARLPTAEQLTDQHEPARVKLRKGIENIGLQRTPVTLAPQPDPPETLAARYVQHLEQHPDDFHTREQLAVLYADGFQRLDLAEDQLEQLIQHPGATPAQIVHWIHLLADLQIRHGKDQPTVRATLERISELFPDSPYAEQAQRRINLLALEFKRREIAPTVKLGQYESNLGLKGRLPR